MVVGKAGNGIETIQLQGSSAVGGGVLRQPVAVSVIAVAKDAIAACRAGEAVEHAGSGDGLLGLAFDAINTVTPGPVPTPVQNMNTEGVTAKVHCPRI